MGQDRGRGDRNTEVRDKGISRVAVSQTHRAADCSWVEVFCVFGVLKTTVRSG
jgi:hypothetical protein